jgi:hypothetical protein
VLKPAWVLGGTGIYRCGHGAWRGVFVYHRDHLLFPTHIALYRTCLFPGGVGKTWKKGDFEKLLGDVTSRVFNVYGDSTVVYPGRGDDTTLRTERPQLDEWKQRGW